MKITTFLLLISFLTVSASTLAQKITLNEKNAQLTDVIAKIRQQSGYEIFYDAELLKQQKDISVKVQNASLNDALDQSLAGTNLTYEIADKTILIKVRETSLLDKIKTAIAAIDVTGQVLDETGQPLQQATVKTKDGKQVTITDPQGYFKLKSVDPNTLVIITYVGYETQQFKASENPGTIKLQPANSPLDAVQVIAYGKQSQRLSVGNVTTITAKDIEKQPIENPLLALQGRVPGVIIKQQSGLPGSGVTIQIQGQNSLENGNDPLIVVDGVPYSNSMLISLGNLGASSLKGAGGAGSLVTGGSGSPLNYLNMNDIESISVLKDAAATAIYGSRAANGAILITTKNGKAGPVKLEINLQNGWANDVNFMKLMNTQQYLAMRHLALKNDGLNPYPSVITDLNNRDYDINGVWDTTRYTDWQKVLLGGTAHYTNYNASISGGTTTTQYLIGANYNRQTTIEPGDFADNKGGLHFSINSASVNQKFKIQLTGSYQYDQNLVPFDLTQNALTLAPDAPALYNPDGTLNWQLNQNGIESWRNPLADELLQTTRKVNNLISNLQLSYVFSKGLTLQTNFGYNSMNASDYQTLPLSWFNPSSRPFNQSSVSYMTSNVNNLNIEPQLNYTTVIGKGALHALLGSTYYKERDHMFGFNGSGFTSDALLNNINAAQQITPAGAVATEYNHNDIFGRISYNWQDKYLFDGTIRRDGSSRFGPANEFHTFYAIGGGWLFSNEQFIKDKLQWLSFGKLRGSYGTTGSDKIGDYQYLSLYYPAASPIAYQGTLNGLNPGGLTNPYLQWEETNKLSLGLDLGLFHDRVSLNATWYRNRTSNQLLSYILPVTTGFTAISKNLPATVENKGWEVSLTTVNVKNKDFSWSTGLNVTLPKTILLSFQNQINTNYNFSIGKSLYRMPAFRYAGLNPKTGIYQIYKKDGTIVDADASAIITQSDYIDTLDLGPKYMGGITNTISYKGFSLDFTFQFSRQIQGNNQYRLSTTAGTFNQNIPIYIADNTWKQPGDMATYEKYTSGFNLDHLISNLYVNLSNAAYSDVLFIVLRNVSLSYQVPSKWAKHLGINDLRIFSNAENVFSVYKGQNALNPETGSLNAIPYLRTITAGIKITP